jgi:cobalt-zinc-cadmium resistance protein CzcA
VVGFAACVLTVAFGMIAPHLGSEFVPRLSEGSITIGVVRLAGTDIEESIRLNTKMEQAVLESFPEVEHTWSRIGTAEIATDPMGVELTDFYITLRPRDRWPAAREKRIRELEAKAERQGSDAIRARELIEQLSSRTASTQAELTVLIDRVLRVLPGQRLAFSQPIELRMNEMISGVRSDLGIKLFGDDFDTLVKKAAEVEAILKKIEGNADVSVEQVTGQPILQIKVKQA